MKFELINVIMKGFLYIVLISCFLSSAHAQFPTKKLTRNITNNVENEIAPFLSMDGNTLIYCRKRAMDEIWKVQISKKANGTWQRPDELKILNTLPKLRLLGSYGLNTDASQIIFSSKRRGGIGNYDLWITKKKGNNWSEPANLAKPVNTPDEDINPIFSVDGKYIYFISRKAGKNNGKVMKCRKKGSNYSTPKTLDLGGDFFCVRIAADQKTMYLSKVVDNQTELYISRKNNNTWSKATKVQGYESSNDKYFGVNSSNTNLLISAKKGETYDLFFSKPTEEYSSVPVTKLTISLPVPYLAEITSTEEKINTKRVQDTYLTNDQSYSIKIKTQDHFTEFVQLDLSGEKSGSNTLSPKLTKKTATYPLLTFDSNSSEINNSTLKEKLNIISNTFNNDFSKHELVLYQNEINTDTVKSDEFHNDISYQKEVEVITSKELVSYDTLGVNEDNLPIIKTDTSIVEEKAMVLKDFPLFSNDNREIWKQEIETTISNQAINLKVALIEDKQRSGISKSGLYFRPR